MRIYDLNVIVVNKNESILLFWIISGFKEQLIKRRLFCDDISFTFINIPVNPANYSPVVPGGSATNQRAPGADSH